MEGPPVTHLTHTNQEMQADYIFIRTPKGSPVPSPSSTYSSTTPFFQMPSIASPWSEKRRRRERDLSDGPASTERATSIGSAAAVCADDISSHLSLLVLRSCLLPEDLPADRWPRREFLISDHRPLCSVFQIETFPILPG
eukprot:TRINITY_DN9249_c0_g1_i2.p1 TRINITY_DN9249_c0_g1~~TRINITY_DN9249_c0_g1_i2.p1  ORF type:complete len:140 (+),score=8.16 TRINITY_DN9249_c0_g1_i2:353-772(+)